MENQDAGVAESGRRKGLKISCDALKSLDVSGNTGPSEPAEIPPNPGGLETPSELTPEEAIQRARERMTPTERLPKTVRVAGYDFKIVVWQPLEAHSAHRYGECSTIEQVIRISRFSASPEKAVDTFLHELLHAIHWAFGVEDVDREERTVNLLSTGLMTVHRDNPWLAPWIAETLGGAA